MGDPFRIYDAVGNDGYPPEWHATIKHLVREQAGHRCERCGHPFRVGANGSGQWSACRAGCTHGGPITITGGLLSPIPFARWRILTVHHLNGVKADCRWFNLCALCQRCHLRVQRVVVMERVWPWPHTDWFAPHAAGWYAAAYLGEDLTREQTLARLDELLALEQMVTPA